MNHSLSTRRDFLTASLAGSSIFLLSGPVANAESKEEIEVGPAEDLMREHGALNRILLIYEEGIRRLNGGKDFDVGPLSKSASIVKSFIENYHEKLEEEFVFPRMKKIGKLADLVDTLETQHHAGRRATEVVEKLAKPGVLKKPDDKAKLVLALQQFVRMYRPHESREDTVLFPAFHESLSEKEYHILGEQFEDREHKLFGKDGFEGIVARIESIEKSYGLFDLAQFTPAIS